MIRTERLEPISLGFDRAVPFGLIVNELVSNAYQHGIADHQTPILSIELYREGDAIVFRIEDNGVGMNHDAAEGTGLLLVRALCSQLHGELLIQSPTMGDAGTRVTIRIPAVA